MAQRAINRLGYDTPAEIFDADTLNSVYTKDQFWIPAESMTSGATGGAIKETYQPPSNTYQSYTVMRFNSGVDRDAFFTWSYKSHFANATINLHTNIMWTVLAGATPPADDVFFRLGCYNSISGATLDFDNTSNEEDNLVKTPAINTLESGNAGAPQDSIVLGTIGNSVISTSDWNLLSFKITRFGTSGLDDFPSPVVVLGVNIQWDVDFNNVAEWPST